MPAYDDTIGDIIETIIALDPNRLVEGRAAFFRLVVFRAIGVEGKLSDFAHVHVVVQHVNDRVGPCPVSDNLLQFGDVDD